MNKNLFYTRLFCICLGLFPAVVLSESVPGGIKIIDLATREKPTAYFQGHRVMVIGSRDKWQAVVGIGLDVKPGRHNLEIESAGVKLRKVFEISDKQYETQYITIKDKRKVNPNEKDMRRISAETKTIEETKASWTDIDKESLTLILPVEGRISSPFGLQRFFNQQPRKPHAGLDIAAGQGTPIRAAANGKIINSGDYFFNGRTIFIDHGQGMLTMYCHMSQIAVNEGQQVHQGDIIGNVGQSGRVTGAHLHWSVILNQAMVDPQLFLSAPVKAEAE